MRADRTLDEALALQHAYNDLREPTNLIEKAVLPLKTDAVERARQLAVSTVERVKAKLAEHGGDINAAAPYPNTRTYGGHRYYAARAEYNLFHSLTQQDPAKGYQKSNGPTYVIFEPKRVEQFIKQRQQMAADDYDAFVIKLVAKIGDVVKADLTGNHVWDHSTLVVTKPDGERQAWKTRQIVNFSKHGKPFNQWPTRRMKKVPA